MRLSTLENELLRPWHFLGLALSSTLSRRTEEVLIKFTVGHFASLSDWLPSILFFLPFPTSSASLFLPPPLFFILVTSLFPLSLSFSFPFSLLSFSCKVLNPREGNESGNKSGNENGNVSGNEHASRHFPRKEIGDRRFFFFSPSSPFTFHRFSIPEEFSTFDSPRSRIAFLWTETNHEFLEGFQFFLNR